MKVLCYEIYKGPETSFELAKLELHDFELEELTVDFYIVVYCCLPQRFFLVLL